MVESPYWVKGVKVNFDNNLLTNMKKLTVDISGYVNEIRDINIDAGLRRQEVFEEADRLYGQFKQGNEALKNKVTQSIKDVTNQVSNLGAKFTLVPPFFGSVGDLRSEVAHYLGSNIYNSPNYPADSIVGGATIVLALDGNMVDASVNIARLIAFTLGKSDPVVSQILGMFNSPQSSAVGNLKPPALPDTSSEFEEGAVDPAMAEAALWSLYSLQNGPQEAIAYYGGQAASTVYNNTIGQVTSAWSNTSVAKLVGTITEAVSESASLQDVINKMVEGGPANLNATVIKGGKKYQVVSDPGFETTFQVTYDSQVYYNGQYFNGQDYLNTFTVNGSNGKVVETGSTDLLKDLGELYGPNTEKWSEMVTAFTNFDPFGKWFDILSIGNLFGKGLTEFSSQTIAAVEALSSDLGLLADAGAVGLSWVNNIAISVQKNVEKILTGVSKDLQSAFYDLDLLKFDILYIPPNPGGLAQLRYANSEYIRLGVDNMPDYSDNTVFVPIIVTYSMPGVFQELIKLFK